jgi:hypothetical protein
LGSRLSQDWLGHAVLLGSVPAAQTPNDDALDLVTPLAFQQNWRDSKA